MAGITNGALGVSVVLPRPPAVRGRLVDRPVTSAAGEKREKRVLHLVHSREMQGAEVGRLLGVSESRVSQILSEVRNNLRRQLLDYDAAAA